MDQEATSPMIAGAYPVDGGKLRNEARALKNPQVVQQLETQDMLTGRLSERLELLFNRIQPVWQSPAQKGGGETEADRAEMVPVAERLSNHNRRLSNAVALVDSMIEGLEL